MNYLVKKGSSSSNFEIHNNSPQRTYDEHTVNWWKFRLKTDSNEIVYEKIDDAMKNINLENLFSELCGYAAGYFDTILNLRLEVCDSTISIGQNENTVYMNSMMSSAYFSFLLTHIYHSYVMDNMNDEVKETEELFCFRALLFILNEMCFYDFEQPADFPDAESIDMLFAKIQNRFNLFNVASDLFYTSVAFAFLHEISHAYLKHDTAVYSLEKEIEADRYAYRIFLDFCGDVRQSIIKSKFSECIETYTYLAPMYLLEFYYTVYYTGNFLCVNVGSVENSTFDDIVKRKEELFEVFYDWDGEVDENLAYGVYNAYRDAEDSFIRSFIASDKAGYFDKIKKKNLMRGVNRNDQF